MGDAEAYGPRRRSLSELAAAGFVTDEWDRWQQGLCGTYAVALLRAHPQLRLGVLGQSEPGGGWRLTHFVAHDATHAYDSAGTHPLPYRGVHDDCDVLLLEQDPDWYGLPEEEAGPDGSELDLAAATDHAHRHQIGPR